MNNQFLKVLIVSILSLIFSTGYATNLYEKSKTAKSLFSYSRDSDSEPNDKDDNKKYFIYADNSEICQLLKKRIEELIADDGSFSDRLTRAQAWTIADPAERSMALLALDKQKSDRANQISNYYRQYTEMCNGQ